MNMPSKNYHDYVFRNGELIGQFEEMYKHSGTVPWHQDEQSNWIDLRLTTSMLEDLGPFDEIHDLGCGLGNYLALMIERLGARACKGFGYDISQTACEKASLEFPVFQFLQLDLTSTKLTTLPETARGTRRLFMIRGTLWYVFPELKIVVEKISSMMGHDDRLLVVQNFPPLSSSFVGKNVIPDHHALISHFSSKMSTLRHIWYEDSSKTTNDNWFIGLFSLKDN